MAKQAATTTSGGPNIIQRVQEFIQEVKVEMSKVAWPSRDELKQSTSVVMVLLGILALIICVYDKVFQTGVLIMFSLG